MRSLKLVAILIAFSVFIFSPVMAAVELNYPYVNLKLKLPPAEDPFPGLGSYYSSLGNGMKSVLWNPASLGKLKLAETSLSLATSPLPSQYTRTTNFSEISDTIDLGDSGSGGAEYGVFFRAPSEIAAGINTSEVNLNSTASTATIISGMNFTTALKVTDWLMIGFAANSPVSADLEIAGDVPVSSKLFTDLRGQTISEMQITNDSKLNYTFDSGGSITTYESVSPLWGGFVSQEVIFPVTTLTEFRNNVSFNSPYTSTMASKLGNLSLGLNIIPINASANIDNDVRAVIQSDATDQFIYAPNFDSSNQSEVVSWITDPDKYGSQAGYTRKKIKAHAGEVVATSKYRGFYSASTTRLDFGLMYDLADWLTFGVALENTGGAALNMKGNGIASYISYRNLNTAEASNISDLLLPGGGSTIDLISNTWVTTTEVQGTQMSLAAEKNYDLPKKMRYGFTLRKPLFMVVDLEQNQTPISIITSGSGSTAREIVISDLKFLRFGLDLFLFKFGLTSMLKPSATGLTAAEQSSLDDAFQYGVFPVKLDLGSKMGLFGYELGTTFGFNAMPIISMLQVDTTSIDLTRMGYGNIYLAKDPWTVSYFLQLDPIATATAYSDRTVAAGADKTFEVSDAKFVQTLGVTYRF